MLVAERDARRHRHGVGVLGRQRRGCAGGPDAPACAGPGGNTTPRHRERAQQPDRPAAIQRGAAVPDLGAAGANHLLVQGRESSVGKIAQSETGIRWLIASAR